MAELDEIRQSLLLAKEALRAPAAARARLRTQLTATGAWPAATDAAAETLPNAAAQNTAARIPAGNAARQLSPRGSTLHAAALRCSSLVQHPVAAWAAMLLLGLGFGAGYWVGHSERTLAGTVSTTGAAPLAAAEPATSLPPSANTSLSNSRANARERATLDDTAAAAGTQRSVTPATATATADGMNPLLRNPRHTARASAGPRAFAAELALVQRAERAIRAGDPELALALLAELDHAFPTPALREERHTARLLAECERAAADGASPSAGTAARARAEQFLAEQPSSLYSDRIRKICALDANVTHSKPSSEGSAEPGH